MARIVLLIASLSTVAAAPVPVPTADQAQRLREGVKLWADAVATEKAGRLDLALPKALHVLAMRRAVYGEASTEADSSGHIVARMHTLLGQYPEAIRCRREILASRQRLHETGHWRIADARLDLSEAVQQAKRTPEQRRLLLESTKLGKQVVAMYKAGESRKAVALAQTALALRKEAVGTRHRSYGVSLNNLAVLHQRAGDYRLAVPLLREALAVNQALLGTEHPDTATSMNNLAQLLNDMGDPRAALPLLRESMQIRHRLLGERHLLHAHSLNNLAAAYRAMGAPSRALPLYKRSLAIREETVGTSDPAYASALSNLSGVYREMGDLRSALRLAREAVAVRERVQGRKHPSFVAALSQVAALHQLLGEHRAALPLTEQVLAFRAAASGETSPDYAITLSNLALLRAKTGDLREAIRLQERAGAILTNALGENHPDNANNLNTLGVLLRDSGKRDRALALFEKAAARRKASLGERHSLTASSLYNLAVLRQEMGDAVGARRDADRAVAVSLSLFRETAAVQPDRSLLDAAQELRKHVDVRLSLPDEKAEAYRYLLAWKGAVLLRQQERRLFARLGKDDARVRAAVARAHDTSRRLAAVASDPAVTAKSLASAVRIQEEAQEKVGLLAEGFRTAREREQPAPAAIAAALPEGAVLVDYLFFNRYGKVDRAGKAHVDAEAAAFVVRKDRPVVRVDLGLAEPIRKAVEAWRASIARQAATEGADARKLHGLVWAPLAKHLAGTGSLLVCPDGVLASVPFAALPGAKEGTRLLEEVPVAVVPSPRCLLEPSLQPAAPSLLVVGDVDFGAGKWAALPATANEAKAVAALSPGGGVSSLIGARATTAAVTQAMAKANHVHLATHGYCGESKGDHPLLQSGLVLAGGNLTALEVSELDLWGMDLAVLSACETGLGVEATGEGLLGLQRAFQVAGCRSVVASLWMVPDAATAVLMERFYGNLWKKKMGKAEALREAQLFVLKEGTRDAGIQRGLKLASGTTTLRPSVGRRTPPLAWAAWVLSGDAK